MFHRRLKATPTWEQCVPVSSGTSHVTWPALCPLRYWKHTKCATVLNFLFSCVFSFGPSEPGRERLIPSVEELKKIHKISFQQPRTQWNTDEKQDEIIKLLKTHLSAHGPNLSLTDLRRCGELKCEWRTLGSLRYIFCSSFHQPLSSHSQREEDGSNEETLFHWRWGQMSSTEPVTKGNRLRKLILPTMARMVVQWRSPQTNKVGRCLGSNFNFAAISLIKRLMTDAVNRKYNATVKIKPI